MSEQMHHTRKPWAERPYVASFWLTTWMGTVVLLARDLAVGDPGWQGVFHLVVVFVSTATVIDMVFGTGGRR